MPEASERDDIHLRGIGWTGAMLAGGIALVCLIAYLLWRFWGPAQAYHGPNAALDFRLPQPALESAPQPARDDYFREKRKLTQSWEWVDRKGGIARIPVEEAMRMLATRNAGAPASNAPKGQP